MANEWCSVAEDQRQVIEMLHGFVQCHIFAWQQFNISSRPEYSKVKLVNVMKKMLVHNQYNYDIVTHSIAKKSKSQPDPQCKKQKLFSPVQD